jgi:hypothetical protein
MQGLFALMLLMIVVNSIAIEGAITLFLFIRDGVWLGARLLTVELFRSRHLSFQVCAYED